MSRINRTISPSTVKTAAAILLVKNESSHSKGSYKVWASYILA